ncbi:EAL domain-containing protein [Pelatocladus sp. BLCC-F211]|uniref:EAL domain-containing protein n=1 Tax=Pelatocladus sp. BLCC-F211 TaxID=3342752 RepID=UPI0035B8ACC7
MLGKSLPSLMKKVFGKLPLGVILTVPFVLQVVAATSLVGYLSFRNGQKAVNDLALQLSNEVSNRVDQHLDTYLSTPHQILQFDLDAIAQGRLNLQDLENSGRFFWKQVKIYKGVSYAGYGLSTGQEAGAGRWLSGYDVLITETIDGITRSYSTDNQGNRLKVLDTNKYDPRTDEWYADTVKAGKPIWSRIYTADGYASEGYVAASANYPIYVPLIICDQTMPKMDGVELLIHLHRQYPKTLKILLTGLASLDDVINAVNHANLYRYMTKPWDETDLGLTVREALRRYEQDKQLAEQNRVLQQMNLELQREIVDRRRAEERLAHDALHDALTGLPNRTMLKERLEYVIQIAQEKTAYQFAVLFIDLDRFKIVNDSLGHMAGDRFLVTISRRLRHCLRSTDMVARLGGDEFTVLLEDIHDTADATQIAERILATLRIPFRLQGHTIFPSASIGIVIGSHIYQNATDLLRDADLAMYQAKGTGRACYALFNQDLHIRTLKFLQIESDLRQALTRQEFVLHYQPIVSLTTGKLVGFEALARWLHPKQGLISPNEFIPVAEETGFIVSLGKWVLREACRQLHAWHQVFPEQATLIIAVNLTAKELREPNLIERIDRILAETGLDGRYLKLELTESMLVDDVEMVLQTLNCIRARNIQLSIDDFGTGYSSLSYLPRFPINTLKIDRSFVSRMTIDAENLEIVRAIATLAHSIGIDAIAEGVETPQQFAQLKTLDCEFAQGYLFSAPLDCASAERMIATNQEWHFG